MESPEQQVCQELITLINYFKVKILELAEEQGITSTQLFALHSINENGELTMRQVANVLHCDASNVTGIVDRLVSQSLLTRQASTSDRRAKTLQLTAKGKRVVEETKAALPQRLGCGVLNSQERASFHVIVEKLCT